MARFMRKGVTKVYWAVTLASPSAPTVANMVAAVVLHTQLSELNGFNFTNTPIDTPDMASAFVSKIPGEDTVGDSSMVFYEDTLTNPIKTALAKNTVGFVVLFPTGLAGSTPAIADKTDVWPAIVASNSRRYSAGNESALYEVVFTCTAPNVEGAVVA